VAPLSEECGISITASAIAFSLRAAARSSHFERFARRDGGWSAQDSSPWVVHLDKFPDPATDARSLALPAASKIEGTHLWSIISHR
jgi:hypothetical protein